MTASPLKIQASGLGEFSGILQSPTHVAAFLVRAHGAGAAMTHRFMTTNLADPAAHAARTRRTGRYSRGSEVREGQGAPPEFVIRLQKLCDADPNVPDFNYGRQSYIPRKFAQQFGLVVKERVVSRWFKGQTMPRKAMLSQLATILNTTDAYLAVGLAQDLTPRDQRTRNAQVDGGVNLIAGLIQLAGGTPIFPQPDDVAAAERDIDLYASIRRTIYQIHVNLTKGEGVFAVPLTYKDVVQIGVIPGPEFSFTILEIPEDIIAAQQSAKGGVITVTLTPDQIEENRIRIFAKRAVRV